jgi:hypothetical protein
LGILDLELSISGDELAQFVIEVVLDVFEVVQTVGVFFE